MNAVSALVRNDSDFVKIVQISDLHFSDETAFPGEANAKPFLKRLLDDIVKQQPDIICVTGDIADSNLPEAAKTNFSNLLALMADRGGRDSESVLRDIWTRSRKFFELLCSQSGIDPGVALFVIPGNHDYRLQGFLPQQQAKVDLFSNCFEGYFRVSVSPRPY